MKINLNDLPYVMLTDGTKVRYLDDDERRVLRVDVCAALNASSSLFSDIPFAQGEDVIYDTSQYRLGVSFVNAAGLRRARKSFKHYRAERVQRLDEIMGAVFGECKSVFPLTLSPANDEEYLVKKVLSRIKADEENLVKTVTEHVIARLRENFFRD